MQLHVGVRCCRGRCWCWCWSGRGSAAAPKLNLPMRVCQLKLPVVASYSFTCQKLMPSAGSMVVML